MLDGAEVLHIHKLTYRIARESREKRSPTVSAKSFHNGILIERSRLRPLLKRSERIGHVHGSSNSPSTTSVRRLSSRSTLLLIVSFILHHVRKHSRSLHLPPPYLSPQVVRHEPKIRSRIDEGSVESAKKRTNSRYQIRRNLLHETIHSCSSSTHNEDISLGTNAPSLSFIHFLRLSNRSALSKADISISRNLRSVRDGSNRASSRRDN